MINEVLDAPSDLSHPIKRNRPVPSGKVSIPLAYVQWIALMVVGVGLGLRRQPRRFGLTMLALWVMGCVYNIQPVRSKDLPYLDVLSESINNPLRMLAGWYMTGTLAFPPTSLLISYWMVGCYFMAIKRYAEYRDIDDPARAAAYRKSFSYYTLQRLLVSIVFYASAAMLFLGAFVMRYRLELILAFPLIALVMAIYLGLAFKPESAVVNPEKLYREPVLMVAVVACAVAMIAAHGRRHPGARHDLPADGPGDHSRLRSRSHLRLTPDGLSRARVVLSLTGSAPCGAIRRSPAAPAPAATTPPSRRPAGEPGAARGRPRWEPERGASHP